MVTAFGPMHWTTVGPFSVQTARVLHYLLYFIVGVAIGASGADRGLLAPNGKLCQRWLRWSAVAFVFFIVVMTAVTIAITQLDRPYLWGAVGGLAFALSCAASCFALLAIFLRWVVTRRPALESLRLNAYGIYLAHYAAVTWIQFALLRADLSGLIKGMLVIVAGVAASWVTAAALRRIPLLARIL
jgi:surface polysaccharide O-acyltransferase-like enzyme